MTEREERDLVEGRYTQAQPETAEPRRVHGRYTGTDADEPAEEETLGAYVGSERDDEPPLVRSTRQRIGDYPRTDRHDEG